ncbi:MAG: hypothetical protein H6585_04285 [Flavobacteriales bacterium]|nr:hypothetical protein [Flavobacteriales bacterium]MCB9447544.1 hypothetical protein [Flavobacteriales bacterium]
MDKLNRPVFAIGTGRCGTHLLESLLQPQKNVAAHHIVDLDGDSFYRYCKWNELNVDDAGLIRHRKAHIDQAAGNGFVYFESNPYLSFHVKEFSEKLNARFIHIIRNPVDVVRSHIVKGWYTENPVHDDPSRATGFQYGMRTNHFFGRIIPRGTQLQPWLDLSQVGKIAWMWNTVNMSIHRQLLALPEEDRFIVRIEDLNYDIYREMITFMGLSAELDAVRYEAIVTSRPGKGKKTVLDQWSAGERREFDREVAEASAVFNYV